MHTNIHMDGPSFDKFFLPHKSTEQPSFSRNKIVNYCRIIVNEATICHKIRKIPYHNNHFSVLSEYEQLNISQLDHHMLRHIDKSTDIDYYLFKYNDKYATTLTEIIYGSKDAKKLLLDTITSFEYVLKALALLNENGICYFGLSPQNIVYLKQFREKPVLCNFRTSILVNKLDYVYMANVLKYVDDYTYLPIEIHLLYCIVRDDLKTVSYAFVEEFCEEYVDNLSILRLFSEEYRQTYRKICIVHMKKYINMERNDIIDDILERNDKWDVYGISVIYLQIFGCILRVFSLKETFVSKIVKELAKNLHPDSTKRHSVESTLLLFRGLIDEQDGWSFANHLCNDKLPQLFDELST